MGMITSTSLLRVGANDEDKYSWMKGEKEFIRKAIDAKKVVLGICLGSQLMANALGIRYINIICSILQEVRLEGTRNQKSVGSL